MPTIKSQIEEKIGEVVRREYPPEAGKLGGILVYRPPEGLGDYATSVAMQLTQILRPIRQAQSKREQDKSTRKPEEIAEELKPKLAEALKGIVSEVQTTPQGFINFTLDPRFIGREIEGVLKKAQKSVKSVSFSGLSVKSALIEFVSANPTGPLTLGNARNAFLGQTLANVLEKVGYKVTRHYYVNDVGRQIEQLGKSVHGFEAVYRGEYIDSLRKDLKINPMDSTSSPQAGGETRRVGNGTSTRRVSGGDPTLVGEEAARIIMKSYIQPTLKRLGIGFDEFVSERELIASGKVKKILERIERDGLSFEKEGAVWLNLKKLGEYQDDVLIKSDGSYTYLASDIAYHAEKMRRANLLVTVLGADNANEARRIKVVVEKYLANSSALGGKWDGKIVNILYQLVHLKEGESLLKISKREGRVITIEDLLGAVGQDAARFFILLPSADTHLELDLAIMREKSAKNPVYYVQYAHARMASILRKAKINPTGLKDTSTHPVAAVKGHNPRFTSMDHPMEVALAKKILMFPELIEEVAQNFSVHHLPNYAIELADTFHRFYEQVRVISEDKKTTQSRLALVMATKLVLKETLELLGINAPERM